MDDFPIRKRIGKNFVDKLLSLYNRLTCDGFTKISDEVLWKNVGYMV